MTEVREACMSWDEAELSPERWEGGIWEMGGKKKNRSGRRESKAEGRNVGAGVELCVPGGGNNVGGVDIEK